MHKSQIHASPVLFKRTWLYSQLLTLPKSSIILTCNSAVASDFGNMSIYWYLFLFGIAGSYYICFRCLYVCLYGMQVVAYYLLISSLFTALLHHTWDEDIQMSQAQQFLVSLFYQVLNAMKPNMAQSLFVLIAAMGITELKVIESLTPLLFSVTNYYFYHCNAVTINKKKNAVQTIFQHTDGWSFLHFTGSYGGGGGAITWVLLIGWGRIK